MLDMGFEPQLKSIIYEFDLCDKGKRQNLMFSATFEPEVKEIARKFMNEFYFVHTNTEMRASQNVTQVVIYAKESEKVLQLHKVLQTVQGSIIIFLDTKRGVENLNAFLDKSNYNCIAIHGDKKQWQRQDAIKKFTSGDVPILIATDVASRGLDFPKVSYVFNFDMPSNIDDYVHRIGRTGRGGDKGTAISFVNENNKNIIKPLYRILNELNQEVPDFLKKMFQECANYVNPNTRDRYRKDNFGGNDFLNKKRFNDYGGANRFGRDQSGFNRDNNYNNQNSRPSSGWDRPQTSTTSSGWDKPAGTTSSSGWDRPQTSTTSSGWDKPPMTNFGSDRPVSAHTSFNPMTNPYPNSQWNPMPSSNVQPLNSWRSETPSNNGSSNSNNPWPVNPSFNATQFPTIQGFSDLPRFPYPTPIPTSQVPLIPTSSYPTRESTHISKEHHSSSHRHSSRDDRDSSHRSRDKDYDRRDRDRERDRDYDRRDREKRSGERHYDRDDRDRNYDRRRDDDRKREDDKKKSSWRDEDYDRDNRKRKY
jgi:superfamily II DNA/RNA helicase